MNGKQTTWLIAAFALLASFVGFWSGIAVGFQVERQRNSPAVVEHTHEHFDTAAHAEAHAHPRGSCWRKTRAEVLEEHPACEACGSKNDLEGHHVLDFLSYPERECDKSNVIILCRRCHGLIGHPGGWKNWNPHVRDDAKLIQKRIKEAMKAGEKLPKSACYRAEAHYANAA